MSLVVKLGVFLLKLVQNIVGIFRTFGSGGIDIFTHCHMLGHGKLAPCSYAYCIGRLNREYGLSFPENDYIDLYADVSGEEIIRRFNRPHEFCKCCGRGFVPYRWQGGVRHAVDGKYDWLIKDSFLNSTVAPAIQTVLKTPAKLLRKEIQKRSRK